MKERRTLVVLMVLVAIAVLVLWWQRGGGPLVQKEALPRESPATRPVTLRADATRPTSLHRETLATSRPTSLAEPLLAHVRGRCVDESGAPLPGCTARLGAFARDSRSVAPLQGSKWHDPAPIVTGNDGAFDFAFVVPAQHQFTLDVVASLRVPRTARWFDISPGKDIDLGSVVLARGYVVRGKVVDERGAPVADVGVRVSGLPLPLFAEMSANDTRFGFTDLTGGFQIEVPLPVGRWPITAERRGYQHVSPFVLEITEDLTALLVTVRTMPAISGIVVWLQHQIISICF